MLNKTLTTLALLLAFTPTQESFAQCSTCTYTPVKMTGYVTTPLYSYDRLLLLTNAASIKAK